MFVSFQFNTVRDCKIRQPDPSRTNFELRGKCRTSYNKIVHHNGPSKGLDSINGNVDVLPSVDFIPPKRKYKKQKPTLEGTASGKEVLVVSQTRPLISTKGSHVFPTFHHVFSAPLGRSDSVKNTEMGGRWTSSMTRPISVPAATGCR